MAKKRTVKQEVAALQKNVKQQLKDAEELQSDIFKQQREAAELSKRRADELAAARADQKEAQARLEQIAFEKQRAQEMAEMAAMQERLAQSEADKKAAQEAVAKAKAEAEAKAKAEADARAAAAAAAGNTAQYFSAVGNVNVAGNVPLTTKSQADLAAENYAKAQAQREIDMKRQSISETLTDRFTRYNLQSLIPTIKRLAQEGASESTITFALQESEAYRRRFAANEERLKKGLQVLDPASYLNAEDKYRQMLRDYGLKQFDTDEYVRKFIENDTSALELSNRIQVAASRIQNADPSIRAMLRDYYKLDDTQLLAYVLDPESQIAEVQRRATAGEIGAAAARQGIRTGVDVAEQLARQGITGEAATTAYRDIASVLPGAERLSQIYGTTLESYGLAEAEQEVFNQLASAQRKRRALTEREIAAFSGTSGTGRSSLSAQTGGAF